MRWTALGIASRVRLPVVSTLYDRVSAPIDITPRPLDGVTWRPLTTDDVDTLVELGRAIAAADHPDWADTREDLLDELGHSYTDLPADSLAAVTDRGEVVAWGLVVMPSEHETLVRVILLGGVAPSHRGRGIGRRLLAWQHGRALQRLAGSSSLLPGWVIVAADRRAPATTRMLEHAGFTPGRHFHNLVRSTSERLTYLAPPDGIRVVGYAPEHSAAAHGVRDEAFRGEGSSQPMSDEQWESMTHLASFAHAFSFVALDAADSIVGLLLTLVTEEDQAEQGSSHGYVWVLGVAPEVRRRGVARSLLVDHLRALRETGIDQSVLDVATDGPGDSLALFTDLGYRSQAMSINYIHTY